MRSANASFITALTNAPIDGLNIRRSIWFKVKDRDTGEIVETGIWTDNQDVTATVINGYTGVNVSRTYYGNVGLDIPSIPKVMDLTIQSVQISMSQIADITQTIFRTYDTRLAQVEIHEWVLNVNSGIPVSPPEVLFIGIIDDTGIVTPTSDNDGSVSFTVVSDSILMLTRRNFRKRSHEGQKNRSNDEFAKYSNSSAFTRVHWGEKTPPQQNKPTPPPPLVGNPVTP